MRYRLRKKYQMGGFVADPVGLGTSEEERKAEQTTKAGIGVVTAINPIVGGGLALGSAIGNMTMDDDGVYKSKFGEVVDNNVNPVTGVKNVLDLFKNPDIGSYTSLASGGLFGRTRRQREKQAQLEQQRENNRNKYRSFLSDYSDSVLANYDTTGAQEQVSLYALGGKLKPINSDTVEVDGATHAQGGVRLGPTAEVENNETIAGDFVFSDFLGFADKHKKLARQIGKIEKKPLNNERRVSLEILRKKEQALKDDQEAVKAAMGVPPTETYQMGGLIDLTTGQGYTEPTGLPAYQGPYSIEGTRELMNQPLPELVYPSRDYSKQPLTVDEWRTGEFSRDYNKYPLTKTEIQSWSDTLKARNQERANANTKKLDLSKHWAKFKNR